MTNLSQALSELKTEDFIWIIYSFIVLGALISNVFEKEWLIKHEIRNYRRFHLINATLFFVSLLIYAYFVYLQYKQFKNSRPNSSIRDLFLNEANFVAACLFFLGGLIYLVTEILSTSYQTEPREII